MDRDLAARRVERREQQRGRRGRAQEPHRATDRADVDALAVDDVQHRALRERSDDLVRRREHRVRAQGRRAGRQVGMEAEVRAPCLIDDERHARRVADLGAAGDVGDHAVVRRRDEEDGTRVRGLLQRPGDRRGRDPVGHAQLEVVLGSDERRDAAAEDEPVDDRRVRVALRDDLATERRQREAHRVVALGRAVREEPGAADAVGLGGEQLRALVGRRRGPDVDALEVLADVERQRPVAEREAQPGVGADAALVAGDVEAPGPPERVSDDGVEVGRGRLLGAVRH